ncbi:hypothetical protein HDU87_007960 [Geranomyces variabilis]|uniref:Cilia- and flagella-associated protein 157 n=1 Tax=Geranomyces variabilis TaxID=109894 RepID=A0AAD5TP06_9FUNG|nr:hypothetical protein HDU87_007960 [Geranomyces variabilis]
MTMLLFFMFWGLLLSASKNKCQTLVAENDALGKAQAKASHDKQDIVEFLNIKVGEHEKQINTMEEKAVQMDQEKADMVKQAQSNLDSAMAEAHKEIDSLQNQCSVYKAQLSDLHNFAARKVELEQQLIYLKGQLEAKERTFKDTVHNIERKVLQDKNMLKREMLQKVNEAVANFQRVADQQMAETTKRAIRENMMITSQLKKMSSKTMELIAENDSLKEKVARLRTNNSLLVESELELAKKNQAHQRSDQLLEVAYDGATVDENGIMVRHEDEPPTQKDGKDFYYVFSSGAATPQDPDEEEEESANRNTAIFPSIAEACNTFDEMAEFWEANQEGSEDPIAVSMTGFIDRLHGTLMEVAELMREGGGSTPDSGPAKEEDKPSASESNQDSTGSAEDTNVSQEPKRLRAPLKHLHPYTAPMKRRIADLALVIAVLPGGAKRRPLSRADGTTEEKLRHEVAVQTLPLPFAPVSSHPACCDSPNVATEHDRVSHYFSISNI